jgi:hypothetical protein
MATLRATQDASADAALRFRLALAAVAAVLLGCLLWGQTLQAAGYGDAARTWPETLVIALLYLAQDQPLILPMLAVVAIAAVIPPISMPAFRLPVAWALPAMALTAFAGAVAMRFLVFHNYDLSLDEFVPRFQAGIFREGLLLAPLSEFGLRLHGALQPFFVYVDADHALWASHYRPVHAGFLALAGLAGAEDLLNPVMAAIATVAMASLARQLWPAEPITHLLAPALLILTPQFLISSGAGFAFPSHLALNLVWLALFLKGGMARHCLAAAVGMAAIGLHQVHFHLLFAAPFLIALLAGAFGRRSAAIPYALGYALALPVWVLWPELSVYLQTGDASVLPRSLFEIDYISDYFANRGDKKPMEAGFTGVLGIAALCRLWLWTSPALLVLLPLGLWYSRNLGLVPRLAAAGFLLNLLANHVLMPNQMQSWGARYSHPVLGNLVLFGLAGLVALVREHGWRPVSGGLTFLSAASVLFLGARALQVEAKVGPRAAVQKALAAMDADLIVVDVSGPWFGPDFVRNDPFLRNRPLFEFSLTGTSQAGPEFSERTFVVGRSEATALGLPELTLYEPGSSRDGLR